VWGETIVAGAGEEMVITGAVTSPPGAGTWVTVSPTAWVFASGASNTSEPRATISRTSEVPPPAPTFAY
jgi:hypothetical protein